MPFSQILCVFQTISQVALFILPISNRRPLFISPEFNSGSKHRSLCWIPSNFSNRPRLTGDFSFLYAIRKKNTYFYTFFFKKICSIQKFIVILLRVLKKKSKRNRK